MYNNNDDDYLDGLLGDSVESKQAGISFEYDHFDEKMPVQQCENDNLMMIIENPRDEQKKTVDKVEFPFPKDIPKDLLVELGRTFSFFNYFKKECYEEALEQIAINEAELQLLTENPTTKILYNFLKEAGYYLPKIDSGVVNYTYLIAVMKGHIFCPLKTEIKQYPYPKKLKMSAAVLHSQITAKIQNNLGYNSSKTPCKQYLADILYTLSPDNILFDQEGTAYLDKTFFEKVGDEYIVPQSFKGVIKIKKAHTFTLVQMQKESKQKKEFVKNTAMLEKHISELRCCVKKIKKRLDKMNGFQFEEGFLSHFSD